ncbi:protein FAM200A-like [Oratosquilla oratoria]|uniref:protein FAM200A-like n=1 Tax=Oratosquilla oratoria TaxID=337810 RepID=UPI003F7635D8
MNANHEFLLFYTAVRWLSKGNVINRVFEMKDEIMLFLETQGRKDIVVHFEDEAWNKRVAYLADIFDQLNKLNLKLQGRETHVLLFQDSLRAFVSKLQIWGQKTNIGNITMFEKLCGVMDESQIQLDQFLKDEITEYLQSLERKSSVTSLSYHRNKRPWKGTHFLLSLMYPASQMKSKMNFWI